MKLTPLVKLQVKLQVKLIFEQLLWCLVLLCEVMQLEHVNMSFCCLE